MGQAGGGSPLEGLRKARPVGPSFLPCTAQAKNTVPGALPFYCLYLCFPVFKTGTIIE